MHLNHEALCFAIGIVNVLGVCVEGYLGIYGVTPDKDARDLKDVELIGKDLKFKLDHGIAEKELLEKTLEAAKARLMGEFQTYGKGLETSRRFLKEPQMDEKLNFLIKKLCDMIGPNFKKEDIPEEKLKAIVMILKSFPKETSEEFHLKKAGTDYLKEMLHSKDSFLEHHGYAAEKGKFPGTTFPDESNMDVLKYLAESILHMKTDKDAESFHHDDKEAISLLKKIQEGKVPSSLGSIDESNMDVLKYLAESMLHMKTDKDAESFHHDDKEAISLLKKIQEGKVSSSLGSIDESNMDVLKYLAESILHKKTNKDTELFHHDDKEAISLLKKIQEGKVPSSLGSIDESNMDVLKYLAESILHKKTDKDAESFHHDDKEAISLLKKIQEGKVPSPEEIISYFLMHQDEKEYVKGFPGNDKQAHEGTLLKVDTEDDDFKKALKLLKDSIFHEEGAYIGTEAHFKKDSEIAEEIAKEVGSGNTFTKPKSADMKTLGHYKEGMVSLEKDRIYDEILKKEETHSLDDTYDEEGSLEDGKGFKFSQSEEGLRVTDAQGSGKSKTVAADRSTKGVVSEEGAAKTTGYGKVKTEEDIAKSDTDKSSRDILKEDGYYITSGTHAYEKARDQAHVDAKVPLVEKTREKIDVSPDHKFHADADGLKKNVYHPIDEKMDSGIMKSKSAVGKEKVITDEAIAYGEDALKIFKTRGIGTEFGKGKEKPLHGSKIPTDGIFKDEEIYGIGLGEEHIKHDFKTDESHLLHDLHSVGDEHHLMGVDKIDGAVDKEESHSRAHKLKKKVLGFMSRILHLKKCYLVNMRPGELLGIVDCISKSKDPLLCEKFSMCEKKMPLQVILAVEKCQKETIPGELKRCTRYEPLYPSRDIPLKIFKCIVKNTHELLPEEKTQMVEFENCARQVKMESCGRIPWG